MKTGFVPINFEDYVELHLKSNPDTNKEEITAALKKALEDYKRGAKCIVCGNPIRVIGSAFGSNMCFTCIIGETIPDDDYEIDEACY
jgi:hypothetical protein